MRLPWWRNRQDDDLREEIATHLKMAAEERAERGEDRPKAEAHARAEFGNELRVRELTRHEWGSVWLEQLAQDLKYAARTLSKSPGFALIAVLVLALGIGSGLRLLRCIYPRDARPVSIRTSR